MNSITEKCQIWIVDRKVITHPLRELLLCSSSGEESYPSGRHGHSHGNLALISESDRVYQHERPYNWKPINN